MSYEIAAALIGGGLGIVAAVAGKLPIEKIGSVWMRNRYGILEIMGTKWAAEWVYDDGKPFVKDRVTFTKWTKKSQFEGYGEVTWGEKEYKYSITGEVSRNGIVVITYKAENYPTEANIGMACMELSNSATNLTGYWGGRDSLMVGGKKVYTVRGGSVTMQKIKDLDQ
jgi:hypothetical protein